MSNQLDHAVCEGIAALADYNNPKRPSHARVTLLFYIALRSASDYFWGSIENTAKVTAMNPSTAGQLFRDLEAIGAITPVPIAKVPEHIAERIKKQLHVDVIPPAKKVWRYTGVFVINGITYHMKRESEGGDLIIGSPNNPNLGSPNNWLTQDIIEEEYKDKDKEKKETTLADVHTSAHETSLSIDTPITEKRVKPEPKPKKSPTPKAEKPPLIVNLTNAQLNRERPSDMSESEYLAWLDAKPAFELMAIWITWNLKKGAYQGWQHYLDTAVEMEKQRVFRNIQDMGKWMQALAKEAGFTLTYEWLRDFDQWYLEYIVCGMDEVKYPTRHDTFAKNFSLYLNYLHQQELTNHE